MRELLSKRQSNQTFGSVSQQHNLWRRLITPLLSSPVSITAKSIAKALRVPTGLVKEICPFNVHFPVSGHKCSSKNLSFWLYGAYFNLYHLPFFNFLNTYYWRNKGHSLQPGTAGWVNIVAYLSFIARSQELKSLSLHVRKPMHAAASLPLFWLPLSNSGHWIFILH